MMGDSDRDQTDLDRIFASPPSPAPSPPPSSPPSPPPSFPPKKKRRLPRPVPKRPTATSGETTAATGGETTAAAGGETTAAAGGEATAAARDPPPTHLLHVVRPWFARRQEAAGGETTAAAGGEATVRPWLARRQEAEQHWRTGQEASRQQSFVHCHIAPKPPPSVRWRPPAAARISVDSIGGRSWDRRPRP